MDITGKGMVRNRSYRLSRIVFLPAYWPAPPRATWAPNTIRFDFDKNRFGALSIYFCQVSEGMAIMAAPSARERRPIYMCEMMECLGIEPGGGVVPSLSLSYATALHRCEACPSKQACRDWLDRMPASAVFAPRFCPNADIFFELQVDQPSAWTNNSRSGDRLSRP